LPGCSYLSFHRATRRERKTRCTGDYVIAHGRFSGNGRPAAWIAADIVRFEDGKLAEHGDVLQDEATKAQSVSGLPVFGDRFPA
jgi:predicted SnoaL-like aldol condensation-catalyzing enzyme